jgi:hypothetical protein
MTPEQENDIVEAYKKGTTATELRERYHTTKHAISTVLNKAGLIRPIKQVLWDPAHVDFLKEQATNGDHSYNEITNILNAKFGTTYSRVAICGKLNRLGISKRPKLPPKKPSPERRTRFVAEKNKIEEYVSAPLDESDALNVSLIDLEDGMCKQLTGDATYCGIATGSRRVSLCSKHHSFNCQKVIPKPRQGYRYYEHKKRA